MLGVPGRFQLLATQGKFGPLSCLYSSLSCITLSFIQEVHPYSESAASLGYRDPSKGNRGQVKGGDVYVSPSQPRGCLSTRKTLTAEPRPDCPGESIYLWA